MKILGIFIMLILTFYSINILTIKSGSFSFNKLNNKVSNTSGSNSLMENKRKKIKLLPGMLYFQGWIKFFKYSGGKVLRPTNFFINPSYSKQAIRKSDLKKRIQLDT